MMTTLAGLDGGADAAGRPDRHLVRTGEVGVRAMIDETVTAAAVLHHGGDLFHIVETVLSGARPDFVSSEPVRQWALQQRHTSRLLSARCRNSLQKPVCRRHIWKSCGKHWVFAILPVSPVTCVRTAVSRHWQRRWNSGQAVAGAAVPAPAGNAAADCDGGVVMKLWKVLLPLLVLGYSLWCSCPVLAAESPAETLAEESGSAELTEQLDWDIQSVLEQLGLSFYRCWRGRRILYPLPHLAGVFRVSVGTYQPSVCHAGRAADSNFICGVIAERTGQRQAPRHRTGL